MGEEEEEGGGEADMSRRGLSSTKFFAVKLTGPFLLKTQRKFSKGGNDGSYFWSRRKVSSALK